jgi:4-amino-4-deoxy-L-arabinose transferase-like glycosyltransferase
LQLSTLAKRVNILLFLAIVAFYLYGLGHLPLVGPDEPRYAQVAREMFLRHDLITPTLGGHTWFEKPALLYWMMIASYKTFGVSEWSARLGPAISGLLTIVAVGCVGRQVERTNSEKKLSGFGFWSAVVLATTLGTIAFSRGASFDIVITMTTTWALAFFLLQEFATAARARALLLAGFYLAVGFSLLAKGLVGIVIPFGVTTLYYVLRREWPARRVWFSLIWGTPLALAIAATWYGPVISRHGWQFVDEFFIQHHFARYISNKFHHPQPIYFYPLIVVPLTLPWTAFLVDALARLKSWQWRGADALSKVRLFSLAWFVMPILFFSFSGSKLPGYILPVLPAAAFLIAERVTSVRFASDSQWALRISGLLCLTLGVVVVVYASRSGLVTPRCAGLVALPLVVAGICSLVKRWQPSAVVIIAGAVVTSLVVVLNCAAAKVGQSESVRDLLYAADAGGYASAAVFTRRGYDRTAEFYANGRVIYGSDNDVVELDEAPQLLIEANKRQGPILVLVPIENLGHLKGPPSDGKIILAPYGTWPGAIVEVIGTNGRVALVAVRPQQ